MRHDEFTSSVRSTVLARKTYNKIFCIGYNKTGTTTLELVLRLYGLSLPSQFEQEIRLSTPTFARNYEPLRQFVSSYDAFQDMPFSQGETYVAADALFPNSKFVLSVRDPDEWFASMCRFDAKLYGNVDIKSVTEDTIKNFSYLFPTYWYETTQRLLTTFEAGKATVRWDLLYNKEYYVDQYVRRNDRIKKYFMNRHEDLLVIDITKSKTTAEICKFLNIPRNYVIEMPHQNRST